MLALIPWVWAPDLQDEGRGEGRVGGGMTTDAARKASSDTVVKLACRDTDAAVAQNVSTLTHTAKLTRLTHSDQRSN